MFNELSCFLALCKFSKTLCSLAIKKGQKGSFRDLNIAWASKSVEVDLATLSKDNLSTSLVPEDIYSQPQAGIPVALQATGNGNCLYNSASLILCGNEQRSHYLRVLVAEELYFNAEFYANHKIFKVTERHSDEGKQPPAKSVVKRKNWLVNQIS